MDTLTLVTTEFLLITAKRKSKLPVTHSPFSSFLNFDPRNPTRATEDVHQVHQGKDFATPDRPSAMVPGSPSRPSEAHWSLLVLGSSERAPNFNLPWSPLKALNFLL